MDRGYPFSPELLRMMLSEERQKFVSALEQGASWKQLNQIKKTINQLNNLLDSRETKDPGSAPERGYNESGPR